MHQLNLLSFRVQVPKPVDSPGKRRKSKRLGLVLLGWSYWLTGPRRYLSKRRLFLIHLLQTRTHCSVLLNCDNSQAGPWVRDLGWSKCMTKQPALEEAQPAAQQPGEAAL